MNSNHGTLTGLATAHTGSRAHDHAPSARGSGLGLILAAAADSALGRSGAPYALNILHQASAGPVAENPGGTRPRLARR